MTYGIGHVHVDVHVAELRRAVSALTRLSRTHRDTHNHDFSQQTDRCQHARSGEPPPAWRWPLRVRCVPGSVTWHGSSRTERRAHRANQRAALTPRFPDFLRLPSPRRY